MSQIMIQALTAEDNKFRCFRLGRKWLVMPGPNLIARGPWRSNLRDHVRTPGLRQGGAPLNQMFLLLGLDMAVHIAAGICFIKALKGCKYNYKVDG